MAVSEKGKERTWSRPAGRPVRGRAALLATLVLGAGIIYAVFTARYQAYDLGYAAAGGDRAIVENWSVPLPLGYELVWWRSTPAGPEDGLRLFAPRE